LDRRKSYLNLGYYTPDTPFRKWGVSLYGSSVKGTWRVGSPGGYPGGEVEKALEMGISFHRGPAGEPGRGLVYGEL
jgi:hypothetical protein